MRRDGWSRWICLAIGIPFALAALASAARAQGVQGPDPAGGVLDGITQSYQVASQAWLPRLLPIAQRTFTLLATIEIAISGLIYGLRREALDDVAARFLLKFTVLAVCLTLITAYQFWIPPIISSFATAGETAIGATGAIDPSDVIDIGISLAGAIMAATNGAGVLLNPLGTGFGLVSALIVFLAYVFIAAQLVLVLVKSYVVLTGGVLFVGLAGFRGTAGYAEGFLNYAVYVGTKIFLLYLVVGVGAALSRQWVGIALTPAFQATTLGIGHIVGGAVVFALMAYQIPNTVAGRITAGHSWGVASALRAL